MNIQIDMPPKPELKWASDYPAPAVPPEDKDKIIAELRAENERLTEMVIQLRSTHEEH
jgi:hypothetical protein